MDKLGPVHELLRKLEDLEALVTVKLAKPEDLDNSERRKMYSDLDLLQLDILEAVIKTNQPASNRVEESYLRIDALLKKLKLVPIKRPWRWWNPLEVLIRFIGVSCSFVLVGMICSLPLLVLRAMDKYLKVDPFSYVSEYFKRILAWFFLFQSGIQADVQGLEKDYFKANCVLMTFSHASNVDGFLVSGTCPIRQLAFGKKELFAVPFFSWISLAFGGVPVDRSNRDRAVKALKRSTDAAKNEKLCIAIAPEGTRSLTGQLLPFKKGTFYMWEEMQAPIVPFVILGAYDLYPVGSWVNQTGCVTVRYLPPIYPSEAADKDHMMRMVRRRMLESLRNCPPGTIGRNLSTARWVQSILGNLAVTALTAALFLGTHHYLVVRLGHSLKAVLIGSLALVIFVTAALYIYYVYIVDSGSSRGVARSKKSE